MTGTVLAGWRKRGPFWTASDHAPGMWQVLPAVNLCFGQAAVAIQVGWLRWSWFVGWPRKNKEVKTHGDYYAK